MGWRKLWTGITIGCVGLGLIPLSFACSHLHLPFEYSCLNWVELFLILALFSRSMSKLSGGESICLSGWSGAGMHACVYADERAEWSRCDGGLNREGY
jgi:hypothetical protein